MPTPMTNFLNRYTSFPALLAMLQNREITLLSPQLWEDRNDAFYMSEYKSRKQLKTLLALCFSQAEETYHHWRVFTHGADGVCITFRRAQLLKALSGLRSGAVTYRKIAELPRLKPRLEDLPFLKRAPYEDEREFRLIHQDGREETETKSFAIPLSCISRVTLNPWLAPPLAKAMKTAIRQISGCAALKVYQTTLLENEQWKKAAMLPAK